MNFKENERRNGTLCVCKNTYKLVRTQLIINILTVERLVSSIKIALLCLAGLVWRIGLDQIGSQQIRNIMHGFHHGAAAAASSNATEQ